MKPSAELVGSVFPNLFIAGVSRAGTTSLHRALTKHPDIASGRAKELWVYNVNDRFPNRERIFQDQFDGCASERYRVDSTPHYFSGQLLWRSRPGSALISENESAIERICSDSRATKFIISLRHPVDRYLSEYFMNRFKKKPDVEASLVAHIKENLLGRVPPHADYLYMSRFGTFLSLLLEHVPSENVKVVFLEEWTKDLEDFTKATSEWLTLSQEIDPTSFEHQNSGAKYRGKSGALVGSFLSREKKLASALGSLEEELESELTSLRELVPRTPEKWRNWEASSTASKLLKSFS